jgi:hypothetical protein
VKVFELLWFLFFVAIVAAAAMIGVAWLGWAGGVLGAAIAIVGIVVLIKWAWSSNENVPFVVRFHSCIRTHVAEKLSTGEVGKLTFYR